MFIWIFIAEHFILSGIIGHNNITKHEGKCLKKIMCYIRYIMRHTLDGNRLTSTM